MEHSPRLISTPQTPRHKTSSSAPPTPHVGYTVPDRAKSHTHHYAGILMQHDSNSDTSVGYISPTHRTTGTSYGTLQTDISNNYPQVSKYLVTELPNPSADPPLNTALHKCVAWLWVITNMVVFGFCTFSLFQPNWLTNSSTQGSLGLVNYCEEGASLSTELEKCKYYQRDNSFLTALPSLSWQVATVVYVLTCSIVGISALLASLCLCISQISVVNKLSMMAGLLQLASGKYKTAYFTEMLYLLRS